MLTIGRGDGNFMPQLTFCSKTNDKLKRVVRFSDTSDKYHKHSCFGNAFRGFYSFLIISTKSAVIVKPGDCPLHHPPSFQRYKIRSAIVRLNAMNINPIDILCAINT